MPNLISGSGVMRFLNRLGELIELNFCFLLCSLPLVTSGAAACALYAVCFRFGTVREGRPLREFFRSFRENLRQGTVLWLLQAVVTVFCGYCALVLYLRGGYLHYAFIPFLVLLGLVLVVGGYLFPLVSQFENTLWGTLRNAVILSLGYLPRSLAVAAVNLLPAAMLVIRPDLFMKMGIFWIFLYFSGAAYGNSRILRVVFAPFLPGEEPEN